MPWKKVMFSSTVTERVGPHNLKRLAAQAYGTAVDKTGFAVYSGFDPDVKNDVAFPVLYFSPKAASVCKLLLQTFHAIDCKPPSRLTVSGLEVAVGKNELR